MNKEIFDLAERVITAQRYLLKYINNTDNFREIVDSALKNENPETQPMVLTSLISYLMAKEENIDIESFTADSDEE